MALSLTPDFLWYMVVHEVAEHVRQNPGRHGGLFTTAPESKQAIVVRDDSLRRDEPSDWYVTGWITSFFAYLQTDDGPKLKDEFGFKDPFDWRSRMSHGLSGYTTNRFPSHVSTLPFIWHCFGTRYNMVFAVGVTGVDFDDDTFLAPRLGVRGR